MELKERSCLEGVLMHCLIDPGISRPSAARRISQKDPGLGISVMRLLLVAPAAPWQALPCPSGVVA